MSESVKERVIVLLFKTENRINLKNWKPISRLSTDYKLIAKVMTDWLRDMYWIRWCVRSKYVPCLGG